MALRNFEDHVHLASYTGVMNRHNGPDARSDMLLQLTFIQIERIGTNIDINRLRASEYERVGRGDKRKGWHYNFIALFQIEKERCKLQRVCARGCKQGLAHAKCSLQKVLTSGRVKTVTGDVTHPDCFSQVFPLVTGESGTVERDIVINLCHGVSHL